MAEKGGKPAGREATKRKLLPFEVVLRARGDAFPLAASRVAVFLVIPLQTRSFSCKNVNLNKSQWL